MLYRYILIAFRNLRRQKLFSFINIAGLAMSLMLCLIALMSVRETWQYDQFLPASGRSWRVTSRVQLADGRKFHMASSPLPLADNLRTDYPFVENAVAVYNALSGNVTVNKKRLHLSGAFTEPAFFTIFGWKLAAGDPATALKAPNSIVLTQETAQRFFGTNDALGQVIHFEKEGDFTVTGVLTPPPGPTHLDFESYASLSSVNGLEQSKLLPERLQNWDVLQDAYTYVVMKPGETAADLQAALDRTGERYKVAEKISHTKVAFEPQRASRIAGSSEMYNDISRAAPLGKVLTVVFVALGILLCACFNYTNLSIVRSLQRAKEVGVHKVNGARRWQVFLQFIIESVITCLLSLALAIIMLLLLRDHVSFGNEFVPDVPLDWIMIGCFTAFSVLTGIVAGAIPAWALSSFQPVKVLKNMVDVKLYGGLGLRKVLIVIQFTLSLTAIIFWVTVYRQFTFKATMDMGFNRSSILNVPLDGEDFQRVKDQLLQVRGVEMIAASSGTLGMPRDTRFCAVKADGIPEKVQLGYFAGDADFIKLMHLTLVAGSGFPPGTTNHEQYIVINEKALPALGIKSPEEAIGKPLWLSDSVQVSITGVVKDFNYQPIEVSIQPMAIRYAPQEFSQLQISVQPKDIEATLASIKSAWMAIHPGETFHSGWMAEQLDSRARAASTVGMLGFLAFLTAAIAGLGLLGIVSYTMFTRKKEIGIRKVMGADVSNLIVLLSKNYFWLIVIASCIALPLGYLGSALFLQMFAYRVGFGAFTLMGCFAVLMGIALLIIISQTWKAAITNPVDSLRNE
ncbi:ABC transporter permease [Chitinophaga vietnamensis]|uniref:ABC transporter permease n=1 Tax=Chitinophaga vietnamensis TaxID=2593957 RepID=UPI0011778158|nr:ABC transporter permease [Chitinophaga vietnamensis]